LFESGDPKGAASYLRQALEHDPAFADAHFNLAMACEELGLGAEARTHWEMYLQLDPSGSWAEIAKRHLDRERP
jgi:Tfp pilus assembly protein PilF